MYDTPVWFKATTQAMHTNSCCMVFAMFLVKGFKAKALFAIFMLPKQVLAPLLLAPKKMVLIVVVLNTISPSRKLGTFGKVVDAE